MGATTVSQSRHSLLLSPERVIMPRAPVVTSVVSSVFTSVVLLLLLPSFSHHCSHATRDAVTCSRRHYSRHSATLFEPLTAQPRQQPLRSHHSSRHCAAAVTAHFHVSHMLMRAMLRHYTHASHTCAVPVTSPCCSLTSSATRTTALEPLESQ